MESTSTAQSGRHGRSNSGLIRRTTVNIDMMTRREDITTLQLLKDTEKAEGPVRVNKKAMNWQKGKRPWVEKFRFPVCIA